jgi:hypothetical protein
VEAHRGYLAAVKVPSFALGNFSCAADDPCQEWAAFGWVFQPHLHRVARLLHPPWAPPSTSPLSNSSPLPHCGGSVYVQKRDESRAQGWI